MARILVVGGGAAGMMASAVAAEQGHKVVLFEQNEKLGKKIYITGKGRCNLTNACGDEEFFQSVVSNEKFLYSAFYTLDNRAVMEFFEKAGAVGGNLLDFRFTFAEDFFLQKKHGMIIQISQRMTMKGRIWKGGGQNGRICEPIQPGIRFCGS